MKAATREFHSELRQRDSTKFTIGRTTVIQRACEFFRSTGFQPVFSVNNHGLEARASASERVRDLSGASPLRAYVLRPVTEGNCVATRRGGEQPEVNGQSATQTSGTLVEVNSIRQGVLASLLANGEAQTHGRKMGSPRS
jgi:hypothetical protein